MAEAVGKPCRVTLGKLCRVRCARGDKGALRTFQEWRSSFGQGCVGESAALAARDEEIVETLLLVAILFQFVSGQVTRFHVA